MKRLLWMCACVCLTACAIENPGELIDGETALAEESGLDPAELDIALASDMEATDVGATDDGAVWTGTEIAAACHGTVSCTQGIPGNWVTTFCGTPSCTNQGCSPGCDPADPDCEIKRIYKQPREQRRDWCDAEGNIICREYRPYPAYQTCTCEI